MKKGFTLAETAIALVVIGILAMLLLPNLTKVVIDRDLIKFKKANSTLSEAIKHLVNSDKWYAKGFLGADTNNNKITSATYFCESLADTLNSKKVDCKTIQQGGFMALTSGYGAPLDVYRDLSEELEKLNNVKDELVKYDPQNNLIQAGSQIRHTDMATEMGSSGTSNGASLGLLERKRNNTRGLIMAKANWYDMETACETFINNASKITLNDKTVIYPLGTVLPDLVQEYGSKNRGGFSSGIYRLICVDINGQNKKEDIFAYGVAEDGKIVLGCKANKWLNQEGKTKPDPIDCTKKEENIFQNCRKAQRQIRAV